MSKRHKRSKLTFSVSDDYEGGAFAPDYGGDMYQAPRGKKPRGKQKRSQQNHKTAYYD